MQGLSGDPAQGQGKKLTEAARFLARGQWGSYEEVIEELEACGAGEEEVQQWRDREEQEKFPVYADNWAVAVMFLELRTQWNHVSGMRVVPTGLRYEAVEATMRMRRVPPRQRGAMLDALRLMEAAYLKTVREEMDSGR